MEQPYGSIDDAARTADLILASQELGLPFVTPFILTYMQMGMRLIMENPGHSEQWYHTTAIQKTQKVYRIVNKVEECLGKNKTYERENAAADITNFSLN